MAQSQGESKQTQIMNYVTKSGYAEPEDARAKVGAPETFFELHIIDLKNYIRRSKNLNVRLYRKNFMSSRPWVR